MENGNGMLTRLGAWLKRPYSDDMSTWGWFAFLGLIAVLAFLWTRVLRVIAAGVQEI